VLEGLSQLGTAEIRVEQIELAHNPVRREHPGARPVRRTSRAARRPRGQPPLARAAPARGGHPPGAAGRRAPQASRAPARLPATRRREHHHLVGRHQRVVAVGASPALATSPLWSQPIVAYLPRPLATVRAGSGLGLAPVAGLRSEQPTSSRRPHRL
jgi:hypothetical protein